MTRMAMPRRKKIFISLCNGPPTIRKTTVLTGIHNQFGDHFHIVSHARFHDP